MSALFNHFVTDCQQRVEQALKKQLSLTSGNGPLTRLNNAIEYSLLNGGKRVRPVLVYAAAKAINPAANSAQLDIVACAVEMIHCYSLIHDDLPAMDNDALRRGKPTCHISFDEATAILAGDALQALAFELLAGLDCSYEIRIKLIQTLSQASGRAGMVGGQAIDLASVNKTLDVDQLETLHQLKTGAIIKAAVAMGACFAGGSAQQLSTLDDYASAIGLAFQVQDDILDIESDTATLGKPQGADIALNKPTYPSLLGLEGARERARHLHQQALTALESLDQQAQLLRELASYIISRKS